jgi:hypothetical protein
MWTPLFSPYLALANAKIAAMRHAARGTQRKQGIGEQKGPFALPEISWRRPSA